MLYSSLMSWVGFFTGRGLKFAIRGAIYCVLPITSLKLINPENKWIPDKYQTCYTIVIIDWNSRFRKFQKQLSILSYLFTKYLPAIYKSNNQNTALIFCYNTQNSSQLTTRQLFSVYSKYFFSTIKHDNLRNAQVHGL